MLYTNPRGSTSYGEDFGNLIHHAYPGDDYYASAHATPADVHLIVEVADASQVFDRDVKGPLYAENGIREYWLADLEAERIDVHRRPDGRRWGEIRTLGPGDTIAPEAFPDFEVAVDDVLP